MNQIRSPICVVVGHVDHGKSTILDYVRGTNIVAKEAGAITQAIGASCIPLEILKKVCGNLITKNKVTVNIPGLLFIDTPGHAAFTSMRERGGSLADIAILVVNINEGIKDQTIEAIKILRQHKTPFVVAANKLDLVTGFKSDKKIPLLQNIQQQSPQVLSAIEEKLYKLVGYFYENGLKAERFDRVKDFTQEVAIIPTSAITGDGMPELLMVVSVLAQKYLEQSLSLTVSGPAKGTILEVKDQRGLGKAMDVIIYDGTLRVNDTIVIGHTGEPIVTKVRALFTPTTIEDMRDKKTKFAGVKEVVAATGVRISAPGIDHVIAGMPLESIQNNNQDEVVERIKETVQDIAFESEGEGVVVKADTLGGVEALLSLLKQEKIPVRKAGIGEISKKDLMDARAAKEKSPVYGTILGFNIAKPAETDGMKLFCEPVIYKIIEDYVVWKKEQEDMLKKGTLDNMQRACSFEYLQSHTFRQSHPAIIGVEILGGVLKKGASIMHDGHQLGIVRNIQLNNESILEAKKGNQVAVSIDGVTAGRHIIEGKIYYSFMGEEAFRLLKDRKELLEKDEIEVLKEIAQVMREENPVWGV